MELPDGLQVPRTVGNIFMLDVCSILPTNKFGRVKSLYELEHSLLQSKAIAEFIDDVSKTVREHFRGYTSERKLSMRIGSVSGMAGTKNGAFVGGKGANRPASAPGAGQLCLFSRSKFDMIFDLDFGQCWAPKRTQKS